MSKELDKKRCGANVEKVIIDEFVPSKKTGLYALAELQHSVIDHYYLNNGNNPTYREDVEIIAKDLQRLEAIDNANPSEALKAFEEFKGIEISEMPFKDDCGKKEVDLNEVRIVGSQLNNDFHKFVNTLENYILKAQELEKVLEIIKKKCLHTDNLNWVATCINYDMYKEKMSEKHNTKVVKINWDDKVVLDYLKLLTQEEFDLLKRYFK
jgi:hypothetical protein